MALRGNSSVTGLPADGYSRSAQWRIKLLLVFVSIGLTLMTLEAGFRITQYLVRGPNSMPTVDHDELCWVHNTNRKEVRSTNSCGEEILTLPAASPYVIRSPKNPEGTRILFLGDSTTHAHEVSTGAAYYDTVERLGNGQYAVWAAGMAGYGNFQEYLMLLKIYEEVRPEIIVWQLDSNDVADNVYELDRASLSSPMRPRPYLSPSSGQMTFQNPGLVPFTFSRGARFLFSQLVGLDIRYELGLFHTIEGWLSPTEEERQGLERQGLDVLDRVVGETRRRYPEARLIGLAVMVDSADDSAYEAIFRRHGAEYWADFTAQVRGTTSEPTDCRPWDRHWNHKGNHIAGSLIAEALERP